MKLSRDLSGRRFATVLRRYGYQEVRQTGSHLRLTSTIKGTEHHITIPLHDELKVGTLNSILADIASYLEIDKETLAEQLFSS
ncbi:MAG: type II toxin-antitoxin system HicA family toxin [Chloroflexi bacterium]|nr:type II toxin-antitoxin system HicA family toxin [Chloroflexota bacterium]